MRRGLQLGETAGQRPRGGPAALSVRQPATRATLAWVGISVTNHRSPLTNHGFLIDTLAIRNEANPLRMSSLDFSNRHSTGTLAGPPNPSLRQSSPRRPLVPKALFFVVFAAIIGLANCAGTTKRPDPVPPPKPSINSFMGTPP